MLNTEYPKCFESKEQFDEWVSLANETRLPSPETNYCFDCTKEYQKYAAENGTCEKENVVFINFLDEDGEPFTFGMPIN